MLCIITGVDNNTYLTVQTLLDTQSLPEGHGSQPVSQPPPPGITVSIHMSNSSRISPLLYCRILLIDCYIEI